MDGSVDYIISGCHPKQLSRNLGSLDEWDESWFVSWTSWKGLIRRVRFPYLLRIRKKVLMEKTTQNQGKCFCLYLREYVALYSFCCWLKLLHILFRNVQENRFRILTQNSVCMVASGIPRWKILFSLCNLCVYYLNIWLSSITRFVKGQMQTQIQQWLFKSGSSKETVYKWNTGINVIPVFCAMLIHKYLPDSMFISFIYSLNGIDKRKYELLLLKKFL